MQAPLSFDRDLSFANVRSLVDGPQYVDEHIRLLIGPLETVHAHCEGIAG